MNKAISYFSRSYSDTLAYFQENQETAPEGVMSLWMLMQAIEDSIANASEFRGELLVDLGCGAGNSFVCILKRFRFDACIAVDGSQQMLNFVTRYNEGSPVRIITELADLETDALRITTGVADMVTCSNLFTYLSNARHVISEGARVLKKGGLMVMVVLTHDGPSVSEGSYKGFTVYHHSLGSIKEHAKQAGLVEFALLSSKASVRVDEVDVSPHVLVYTK